MILESKSMKDFIESSKRFNNVKEAEMKRRNHFDWAVILVEGLFKSFCMGSENFYKIYTNITDAYSVETYLIEWGYLTKLEEIRPGLFRLTISLA